MCAKLSVISLVTLYIKRASGIDTGRRDDSIVKYLFYNYYILYYQFQPRNSTTR